MGFTKMGARVNYIFDDGTNALTVLYSHWGAESIDYDLEQAFAHADVRLGDNSYWTRMVISHLIQDELLDETGYGIYAVNPKTFSDPFDEVVEIDLVKETVNGYSFDSMLVWQNA